MATKLSVIRAVRGNLKGSLTKLSTFTESISEATSLIDLQLRVERAEELWLRFNSSQESMYELTGETGYTDPEPEFEEFESKFLMVKSVLLSTIRDRSKVETTTNNSPPVTSPQQSPVQQTNVSHHYNEHLPKIHIEPFSGSYREWPAFRDMFASTVHNKPHLSPSQKFQLLRSNLRGEALNLLSHIPISDATYEQAWERLEKRYDRPRYIIDSFLETFMQLPSASNPNVKTLRKISDCADEIVRGLDAYESADRNPWMIYILLRKVDPETQQAWAADKIDEDYPKVEQFLDFLERRCEALESCRPHTRETIKSKTASLRTLHISAAVQCPKCNAAHPITQCTEFLAMTLESKREFTKSSKLCFNCLRSGHKSSQCSSKFRCRICQARHHSLVHFATTDTFGSSSLQSNKQIPNSSSASTSNPSFVSTSSPPIESVPSHSNEFINNHSIHLCRSPPQTLLPTAIARVKDQQGFFQEVRILIDSGSQVSFVTESCIQRLGLRRVNARMPIKGIGSTSAGMSRGLVSMVLASRFDEVSISVDTYILSNLTSALPTISFDIKDWDHIVKLDLADPFFNESNQIDILLGADRAFDILKGEIVRSSHGLPIAQNTMFGWVLSGQLRSRDEQPQEPILSNHTLFDIDATLQAFWRIEEVDPKLLTSLEDKEIEEHFLKHHRRDKFGKYVVKLPFRSAPCFTNTLGGAVSRLKSMEVKFSKNHTLFQSYSKFMEEYLTLGHMQRIPCNQISKANVFYLPHHAVLKPDSATTKLRVVFDGSFKDTSGNSLNESLMTGPPIQRNLFSVCLRFRRHKYVFTADIVKMFRQIRVASEDLDYQRIVWRRSPADPLEHYRLCTVTYGTSCAPYLSVRVLEQLAEDYKQEFPVASEILRNDFYVDDVVSGGDTLPDAIFRKQRLIELLSKAGLELSKWQSNCSELLDEPVQSKTVSFDRESDLWVKVLGLYWNPDADCFSFRLNLDVQEIATKRNILKDVARIFDPLGFVAPSVVQLKILFQELWHKNLNWDDILPDSIAKQWYKSRQELVMLTKLKIPRCIGIADETFQLHGFSDASASAYAAVIYARYKLDNGEIKTNIVAAKTRVAPINQLSIPRLELCAALLLSRLLIAVQRSLNITCSNVFAWCDSQVVLSWLSSPPRRWEIFVGNRTAEILNTIPRSRWFHIKSAQNPADCASRGIAPSNLVEHPIWWTGPQWLCKSETNWPLVQHFEEHPNSVQEEKKSSRQCFFVTSQDRDHPFGPLAFRVPSWNILVRAVAFINRIISKGRKETLPSTIQLIPSEIYKAKYDVIRWLQKIEFGKDIEYYLKHKHFSNTSKLSSLNPFFDQEQILRVGGRIQKASMSFNAKHPIILPKGHVVTKLIALDFHERLLHPGVSTLFVLIRQQYWILGCRNLLRRITHDCVKCFRQRKQTAQQIMGDLPGPRIQQSRPFEHCGVDYAGPISIKTKIGRKTQTSKGYISLFVCLATKAIHLELVTELTTDAFLAALRRFTARRGKPTHMYSDNGTNFRGSSKRLSEMHAVTQSQHHNSIIAESLARDTITWHFIPPSAPHFGGLWEAGVKSVKQHLKRVIGPDTLTFEALYTLLTQIEALLNSRPLCQPSDIDLDPLTPSHFLIGQSYSAVPEPSTDVPQNRLLFWQAIQARIQGFWRRWSSEYVTSLQQRPQWSQPQRNFKKDDLVVIKESNLPPGKWALGRVTAVHPGEDGNIRVVTLRTARGSLVRPIHKLALLPTN